jgi:hypothetical protein
MRSSSRPSSSEEAFTDFFKHTSALIVAGIALLLTCITVAGATAGSPAASSRRPVAGIAVLRYGSSASTGARHLHRYSLVVLGKGEYRHVGRIKRSSRTTKVLGYENATDLVDDCIPVSWVCPGITYQQAQDHDARYPRDHWILKSASGESLRPPRYSHHHLANVGSRSYQRTWLRRVSRAAATGGFDGVMIDGITGRVSDWTMGSGVYPTAYPSDTAWERAMRRFVRLVGPALKRRGLYLLANTFKGGSNDGSTDVAWWKTVAPYFDGLMSEFWEQSPINLRLFDTNRCCWTGHWNGWLKLGAAAQQSGADFFPLQYGSSTDTKTMSYGKASFLLVWDGSGGGYIFEPRNQADPWNPAWTTPVGKPSGPRRRVGVGWRRKYTRGTVLVNPDPTTSQTFSLGRTYLDSNGARVTSVMLQPVTGMILRELPGPKRGLSGSLDHEYLTP